MLPECEWDYFDSFYEEYIEKLNLALVMAFLVLHNLICMCGIQKCISMKFIIQAKIMSKEMNSNWNSKEYKTIKRLM